MHEAAGTDAAAGATKHGVVGTTQTRCMEYGQAECQSWGCQFNTESSVGRLHGDTSKEEALQTLCSQSSSSVFQLQTELVSRRSASSPILVSVDASSMLALVDSVSVPCADKCCTQFEYKSLLLTPALKYIWSLRKSAESECDRTKPPHWMV